MTSKIKVLHFMGSGKIGGQERAMFQLFKALHSDSGIEIAIALGNDNGFYIEKIRELELEIIPLYINSGFNIRYRRNIIRKLKKFDIHHLHDPSPNIIIYSLLAGNNVKRVVTRRGGLFEYSKSNIKKKMKFVMKKILLKQFDGFSGNSLNAVQSLKKQYGYTNKKIWLLYNGIDFKLLKPLRTKTEVIENLGLKKNQFLIGTAARLVDWKRIDLLIRAFNNVNIPGKKLLIFGTGKELENLKKLASDLRLNKQVIFAGEVEHMPDYYQILDCFVLPSNDRESFGNAVVEAMYLKIPTVVMADSGGLREHIQENITGFVAENEDDLVQKIENIYSHPKEAQGIARCASKDIQQKYSIANMVNNYKEFYQEIL